MGTVVGSWRLKLILLLVIFSSAVYTANAVFGDISGSGTVEGGYIVYDVDNTTKIGYNESDIGVENSQSFLDVLFGIGDFLTFEVIDNFWARVFFNAVMGIVWLTIGYIVFTFIKEWIPLV